MKMKPSVFQVKSSIKSFGIWYAIWHYGASNAWTIFVATRMIKREDKEYQEATGWLMSKNR
jgi:hypothetical protein